MRQLSARSARSPRAWASPSISGSRTAEISARSAWTPSKTSPTDQQAKYILVTAITPTPLGEGKTTTSIGLAQGFGQIGKRATLALAPTVDGANLGIKGGAAGGGYSQVIPMEKLNLHLTGDFHAITAAHNLLAAMMDNHLYQGNELGLDMASIEWRRVMDVNDRALCNVIIGLGTRLDGVPRQTGFDITAASELMVLLALATSEKDLRDRVGKIVVGYTKSGEPITAEDLKVAGSMAVILRDALRPNVLQTIEGQPALIHTGPFGNIATGQSSIVADLIGIRSGDYLITEAGFGADIGAEKFFDMKCRMSGLQPSAAVVVATVRALKAHSGRHSIKPGKPLPPELLAENPDEVAIGGANLRKHLDNLKKFGVTPVVAINAFPTDHDSEHEVIAQMLPKPAPGRPSRRTSSMAGPVLSTLHESSKRWRTSRTTSSTSTRSRTPSRPRSRRSPRASTAPRERRSHPPRRPRRSVTKSSATAICRSSSRRLTCPSRVMPRSLGAPKNWGPLPVRELRLAAGAGYIYAVCGEIRTMPASPATQPQNVSTSTPKATSSDSPSPRSIHWAGGARRIRRRGRRERASGPTGRGHARGRGRPVEAGRHSLVRVPGFPPEPVLEMANATVELFSDLGCRTRGWWTSPAVTPLCTARYRHPRGPRPCSCMPTTTSSPHRPNKVGRSTRGHR